MHTDYGIVTDVKILTKMSTLFAVAMLFFVLLVPAVVNAIEINELVPPILVEQRDGGGFYLDDSYGLELRFINRATIAVSLTGPETWAYDGVSLESVIANANSLFYDKNLDRTIRYQDGSGGSDSSETFSIIDRFSSDLDNQLNKSGRVDNPDYIGLIDVSALSGYLTNVELTIAIDEDVFDGSAVDDECDPGGLGNNFDSVLVWRTKNNNAEWLCENSGLTDGVDIGDIVQHQGMFIKPSSWKNLENFNITYEFNGETGPDGLLSYVSSDGGGPFGFERPYDFVFCEFLNTGPAFVRDNCNQKGEYIDTTPEQLNSRPRGNLVIKHYDNSKTTEILYSGPGDEAYEESQEIEEALNANETTQQLDSCASNGGVMAWIICPFVRLLNNGIEFLDQEIGRLLAIDSTQYDSANFKKAWSNIRNIAYILLVPIMMVMVIGTALGFDFVSAYTVKKALPRMIAAIIFIALSYTLSVFMIELSNVIGQATLGIITSPFSEGGIAASSLSLDDLTGGNFFDYLFVNAAVGIGIVLIIWLFGGVMFLAIMIGFLTLLLRQMFIIALLLVAPLAILAWIFPGNDKLWKIWWGSFSKLLMMFPLIMGLIAIGRVFAFIVKTGGGGSLQGSILNPIIVLTAYLIPYALIPLTFKFAGGMFATVTGAMNDKSKGLFDKSKQKRAAKFERGGRRVLQKRADWHSKLQDNESKSKTAFGRFARRQAARGIGGYNIEARASAKRKDVHQEVNDQIATGRDEEIRGLSVNKEAATEENGLMRIKDDGTRQFKSLGGAWVNEAHVDAGHRRWGNDTFAQQASLSYEMRKAITDDEISGIGERYENLATGDGGWGLSVTQAAGNLKGAGYENQNTSLEFKHMNTDGTVNYAAFSKEIYEKRGSYPMGQMTAHTIEQLKTAYNEGDDTTKAQVKAISETFMYRGGAGGQAGEADGIPRMDRAVGGEAADAEGGGRQGFAQSSAPGAAHVAETVNELAKLTGTYTEGPDRPQN